MASKADLVDSKRELVYERLQRREDNRQAFLEKKRIEKEHLTVANEKIGHFSEMFGQAKAELQTKLDSSSQVEKMDLPHHFDTISADLQILQKHLSDSVIFLPPYDVRVSQASIKALQEQLQQQKDALLPKKKFAFKSRRKETGKLAEPITNHDDVVDRVLSAAAVELCGIQDLCGEWVKKEEKELQNQDVGLYRLRECNIFLLGCPSTVHMSALSKCRIFCGPVKTSVFIDNCKDCTFVVSCQQLRIHTTTCCDFYIHVSSNPIIEDCTIVRFAPYNLSYASLEDHLAMSDLNLQHNQWHEVNDFNWLAADVPSPNWSVIAEDERVKDWGIDSYLNSGQIDLPV